MGEMADEMLLASARMQPARLQEAGFTWKHPEFRDALQAAMKDRDRR